MNGDNNQMILLVQIQMIPAKWLENSRWLEPNKENGVAEACMLEVSASPHFSDIWLHDLLLVSRAPDTPVARG